MDFITYSVSKKLAEAAVSGVDSISAEGSNVIFKCKNGEDITVDIPAPKGVTVTNAYLENSHLFLEFSNGDKYDTGEIKASTSFPDLTKVSFLQLEDNPKSVFGVTDIIHPDSSDEMYYLADAANIQNVLNKKISRDDVYDESYFPRWGGPNPSTTVPSLGFLQEYLLQDIETNTSPSSNVITSYAIVTRDPDAPNSEITEDDFYKITKTYYLIVSDEFLNSYNKNTEICVSQVPILTSLTNATVGKYLAKTEKEDKMQHYEPNVGGASTEDRFFAKNNILHTIDTQGTAPYASQVYSAKVMYNEIKLLRQCIIELYKQINT